MTHLVRLHAAGGGLTYVEPVTEVDWTAIDSELFPATYRGNPVYCHGYPVLADIDGYLYVVDENLGIRYLCTTANQHVPKNPRAAQTVHLGNAGDCWIITDEYGTEAMLEEASSDERPEQSSTGATTRGAADGPKVGAQDDGAEKVEIATRLRQLGSAAVSGAEAALVEDVKSVMETIEGIFHPSFVLSGVVFLHRVAPNVQYWHSAGASAGDLTDLLNEALTAHGTTMRVDRLPMQGVQAYLDLGYALLHGTWSGLRTPEDRTAFIRENMNTGKHKYDQSIEALGRPPGQEMETIDIVMEHMLSNIKRLETREHDRPSSHFIGIERELASGKDSAALRTAIEKSFTQVLGALWKGHLSKHASHRRELHLDVFTELTWGDMEIIAGFFPEAAHMLVRSICPDRESLKLILGEQLMLWAEDGSYIQI